MAWEKETGYIDRALELLVLLPSRVCWTPAVPAVCSRGDVCLGTGFLASCWSLQLLCVFLWLLHDFISVMDLVFFCSAKCLGVFGYLLFLNFQVGEKKKSNPTFRSIQFNQQHRENSPETSKYTQNRICIADIFIN